MIFGTGGFGAHHGYPLHRGAAAVGGGTQLPVPGCRTKISAWAVPTSNGIKCGAFSAAPGFARQSAAPTTLQAFGRQYADLEFDLQGEVNLKRSLMVSLASDIYALKALVIMFAWLKLGCITPEELPALHFEGNMDAIQASMKHTRGSKALLQLDMLTDLGLEAATQELDNGHIRLRACVVGSRCGGPLHATAAVGQQTSGVPDHGVGEGTPGLGAPHGRTWPQRPRESTARQVRCMGHQATIATFSWTYRTRTKLQKSKKAW